MEMTQTKPRGLLQGALDRIARGEELPTVPFGTLTDAEFYAFIERANKKELEDLRRQDEVIKREKLLDDLERVLEPELKKLRKKPSTARLYAADVRLFKAFCENELEMMFRPAAPEAVCHFLLDRHLAGASLSTIRRYVAAITYLHRIENDSLGYPYPCPTDSDLVKAMVATLKFLSESAGKES